jgi:hypothetical protein
MARYQFRNLDGTKPTVEQLASFPIPALVPPAEVIKPVYPLYGPQAYEAKQRPGMTHDELALYRQIWETYWLAVKAYGLASQTAASDYRRQFTDFAAVLENTFVFYTGTWNGTTRTWSWTLLPGVQYSFIQAAKRLIKFTGDKTAFILNSYFGW